LADDFLDDFFFEDFFFFVFFVFVAFFAGSAGAGFATAFGAALAAGFRAPGVRKSGEVKDPGTGPELDVHGGSPIMPHACATLISLFAEAVRTSDQATMLSMSTRRQIKAILMSDHPAVAQPYNKEKTTAVKPQTSSHRMQIR
jgi:hypothetical protein